MKSYTDISQSKKLAEILPFESADMCFNISQRSNMPPLMTPYSKFNEFFNMETPDFLIPCWSFSALLSVLPKNLNIGRPSLDSNYMGYYWIQYYDEFMKPNNYKTECFNNPIDACYDMIIKLNGLNLL